MLRAAELSPDEAACLGWPVKGPRWQRYAQGWLRVRDRKSMGSVLVLPLTA